MWLEAEQAWGGMEVTRALLLGPPHLVFPPQPAMCVHVYICICDLFGLFCVLEMVPKCVRLIGEGLGPPHHAGGDGNRCF